MEIVDTGFGQEYDCHWLFGPLGPGKGARCSGFQEVRALETRLYTFRETTRVYLGR